MCGEIQIVSHITPLYFFLPNFDLKNMISTHAKPFSWKKKAPKFTRFKNKIKSKSPDFMTSSKNIKGFWFFFPFPI